MAPHQALTTGACSWGVCGDISYSNHSTALAQLLGLGLFVCLVFLVVLGFELRACLTFDRQKRSCLPFEPLCLPAPDSVFLSPFFLDRISIFSWGTQDPRASASWVLGSQVCTTWLDWVHSCKSVEKFNRLSYGLSSGWQVSVACDSLRTTCIHKPLKILENACIGF
jgi:hypothetical protein